MGNPIKLPLEVGIFGSPLCLCLCLTLLCVQKELQSFSVISVKVEEEEEAKCSRDGFSFLAFPACLA